MSLTTIYCNQCASLVETKLLDGKLRIICVKCETVFYKNPLPVAASVVLNEKRQVLLVKRKHDPACGLWCLPIGFAEIGETIQDAALRELYEEAGIHGEVVRLLDTRSTIMELYGDVLAVTFEIRKTGGTERAGDDASDAGYFDTDNLPPMAFDINNFAIQCCIKENQDNWAIQDSFRSLEDKDRQNMLSDSLLTFIKDNALDIADIWYEEVCVNPLTPSYSMVDMGYLKERVVMSLFHFREWLSGAQFYNEYRDFYRSIGIENKAIGFELHEIISSLSLLRKLILDYAHEHGVWNRPLKAYRVLELDRRIMIFFDEMTYHTALGYTED